MGHVYGIHVYVLSNTGEDYPGGEELKLLKSLNVYSHKL